MSDRLVTRALPDTAATERLGSTLARIAGPGLVVHLRGDLGAGKTTLARAFIQARVPGARVKSPTYTLVETYDTAAGTIQHLDLYRVADPGELEFLGLRDIAGDATWLVEWPERGGAALPPADLDIELVHRGNAREARVRAASAKGVQLLADLPTMS